MTATGNPFTSPDTNQKYSGKVKIGHAGRYVLPDPITGQEKHWTRVSTIAHVLADSFMLDQWKARMLAKGMGLRPDLGMVARDLDVRDDRDDLQEIADKAMEAAGASVGANMGTALHKYAERLDAGEDLSGERMHESTKRALNRYQKTMQDEGLIIDPGFMERVVLNYEYGIVGRLDRAVNDPVLWSFPRIGDLKTQKTMDFGGLEIAMQLALYARADYMWNEDTSEWEEFPKMDLNAATVIHLPAQSDECEIYDVDIDVGWQCVRLAMNVRKARKIGKGLVLPRPNDRQWRIRIMQAKSKQDLSAIWQDAQREGKWSKRLQQFAMDRLKEIQGLIEPQI